jgi:hypothetical protein
MHQRSDEGIWYTVTSRLINPEIFMITNRGLLGLLGSGGLGYSCDLELWNGLKSLEYPGMKSQNRTGAALSPQSFTSLDTYDTVLGRL